MRGMSAGSSEASAMVTTTAAPVTFANAARRASARPGPSRFCSGLISGCRRRRASSTGSVRSSASRDTTGTFFHFDDYWVMADAARVHLRQPLDVLQFFVPGHNGFALYRPLSTVAYFYGLNALFGYDHAAYHAAHLTLNVLDAVLVYA